MRFILFGIGLARFGLCLQSSSEEDMFELFVQQIRAPAFLEPDFRWESLDELLPLSFSFDDDITTPGPNHEVNEDATATTDIIQQ